MIKDIERMCTELSLTLTDMADIEGDSKVSDMYKKAAFTLLIFPGEIAEKVMERRILADRRIASNDI